MTILLTVTVINGTDAYNSTQKTKLQSEINQIELLTNNYMARSSKNDFEEVVIDYYSFVYGLEVDMELLNKDVN